MMPGQKHRVHYAWVTLGGTCVMMAIGFGMALNSMGVFFPAVAGYLGTGTGAVASFMTIQGLCMVVGMVFVGRIVPKYDYNHILLAASVVLSGGYLLMSFFTALWQWYLIALPTGIAIAFIAPTPISIIISNWFEKKRGFASGIAFAFSGIAGAILVPTCNWVITNFGWRNGYRYYGIVSALFLIPTALFIIRKSPQEKHCLPYGTEAREGGAAGAGPAAASVCERGAVSAEGPAAASVCERGAASAEGPAAASAGDGWQGGTDRGQTGGSVTEYGVTLKEAQHRPSFYLVIFVAAALTWAGGMNSHFPTHSRTLGFGTEIGSFMSSACLVMQLLFNVPLGMIIDRFGVKSAVCLYSSVAAAGSLLLCGATARWALFLASMLYGVGMCQTMVVTSLLTRTIFGRKEYGRIQAVVMTAFGLSGALGYTINGYLLDLTGSYQISFAVTALCDLAAIGACVLALRLEKEQIRANEALEGVLV